MSTNASIVNASRLNLDEVNHSGSIAAYIDEKLQRHHMPCVMFFIFTCCGAGAVLRTLLRKWEYFVNDLKFGSVLKMPYTIFLLLIGMAVAGLTAGDEFEHAACLLNDMDPELFFHIFLPVVIFECAYVIDTHIFWRSIGHVTILAIPGLLISIALTAVLSFILPELRTISNFEIQVYVAVLFGAIISATDPVAVVALLKDLGNQKYLGAIIEGEALLNDGTAIVFFRLCTELLLRATPFYNAWTDFQIVLFFFILIIFGPMFGFFFAKLGGFILGHIYNDALSEITVTLSFTYLTFYCSEMFYSSGVLGVVVFGLALDRAAITPQVDHFLHRFWEMLAYLANTLIFVIVGLQISDFFGRITWFDFGYLIIIYAGITVIRAFSIFCFLPVMSRLGIEINWRHVLVMTWGGLRGAIGLALAIYLNTTSTILSTTAIELQNFAKNSTSNSTVHGILVDSKTTETYLELKHVFQKILLHTGGIVLLSLLINSTTIEAVLGKLGMLKVSTAQQLTMLSAVNRIQQDIKRSVNVLKYDRFLADARWSIVQDMTEITYPYKDSPTAGKTGRWNEEEKVLMLQDGEEMRRDKIKMSDSEEVTLKSLFEEARLRVIKALKMSYWRQYSNGMLTDQEARLLISVADAAADKPGEFIDVEMIRETWQVKGFLRWFKAKLEDLQYGKKTVDLQPPGRGRHIRRLFRIVTSKEFEIFMQCVILINIVPIIMDFVVDENTENAETWWRALQSANYIFIIIYCVEAGMKYFGLGFRQYFKDKWNWFDIFILLLGFVEVIIDIAIVDRSATGNFAATVKTTKVVKFGRVAKSIRVLRATRLLRLTKTVIPRMITLINKRIHKRLSFGYDIGKGFVMAEEEVAKLIPSISENRAVQEKLMAASNRNRLQVIREMGLLQRDNPGIAISVKTRSAVRTILNQTRDTIHQLCAGGVLDDTEMQLLEKGLEIRLKRRISSCLPPQPPENLLENIPWMLGDEGILSFIRAHSVIKDYDYGDIIMQEGDRVDGIHIVIYGMIKLVGSLHGQIQLFRLQPSKTKDNRDIGVPSKKMKQNPDEDQEDFLCSGNIIGEIGLLTGTKRSCTVTCETAVQTFFISTEDMLEAFLEFPKLKHSMWQVVGMRISAPLFMDHITFQGFGIEKIHLHLSRGYIIELTEEKPTFHFWDDIEELSVIHGSVHSPVTGDTIECPALVFPDQDTLTLSQCDSAVLLIIPKDRGLLLRGRLHDSRSLVRVNSNIAPMGCMSGHIASGSSKNLLMT